jgi:hypothetical protein
MKWSRSRAAGVVLLVGVFLTAAAFGQGAQSSPTASKLVLDATSLPLASPRHPYTFQFQLRGGTPPLKWEVVSGTLPPGIALDKDGLLSGVPTASGEFHFTLRASDSGSPAQTLERDFVLRVVEPLMLQWKDYARVTGNRIAGRVEVSNSTEDDFDFTIIVLAVNEIGKAFAIGYQHFPLKRGVESMEIPFGDTLPAGQYVVHVDAVGEVPPKDSIYRARLQTREQLPVTVGP